MKVLVTGTAGFIGWHLTGELLSNGFEVVGLDIINDYYDVRIKYARLAEHGISTTNLAPHLKIKSSKFTAYSFVKADIADHDFIVDFMQQEKFDYVVNLAAQAGVRYSIDNPRAYTHSNIDGFLSVLEGARHSGVKHLVYASTSSVYGLNTQMPLVESMPTEHPMALYAATKKANEMMAHSYSHLFDLPTTGLRFFTVYGPWGRPDMALFLFADAILADKPIKVFNHGNMVRDFTYVGDIVKSIRLLLEKPPVRNAEWNANEPDIATSSAPYRVLNIGNSYPVMLNEYIGALEQAIGKKAIREMMGMQPGDVPATHANTQALEALTGFRPSTTIQDGIQVFVDWYKAFYNK
jgi:UDP-glucuronate 4-epimerase